MENYYIERSKRHYRNAGFRFTYFQHWLCGRDDDNEFRTQVPSSINTVSGAIAWLRPNLADRRDAQRQGDVWYAPVDAAESQKLLRAGKLSWEYLYRTLPDYFFIALNLYKSARDIERAQDRARRFLISSLSYSRESFLNFRRSHDCEQVFDTRHYIFGDIYRVNDREQYAIGYLLAPDHPPVFLSDWHRLDRNNRLPSGRGGD